MATDKDVAVALLSHLSVVADARIRAMMGGYVVYVNDKVVGGINDNELFIKDTPFGDRYAPDLTKRAAYPGSKPAFAVPATKVADAEWLQGFIDGTFAVLFEK